MFLHVPRTTISTGINSMTCILVSMLKITTIKLDEPTRDRLFKAKERNSYNVFVNQLLDMYTELVE